MANLDKSTIIMFNEEEESAWIAAYDGRLKRCLAELADSRPEECQKILEGLEGNADYVFPKAWVRIQTFDTAQAVQPATKAGRYHMAEHGKLERRRWCEL